MGACSIMDLERLKSDYTSLRDAYGTMNRSYVQECAHNQLLKNDIDKLKNQLWIMNGKLKKIFLQSKRYHELLVKYCNGEMTLERLKSVMEKDNGPNRSAILGEESL